MRAERYWVTRRLSLRVFKDVRGSIKDARNLADTLTLQVVEMCLTSNDAHAPFKDCSSSNPQTVGVPPFRQKDRRLGLARKPQMPA